MILTCPDCATRYYASEAAIGSGRMVRCASCGLVWRARPERALDLTVSPEEGAVAAHAPEPDAEEPQSDILDRPVSELPADELPKAFRARAEAERKVREARAQGVIWAGMGAALALVACLAVVFRLDVVQVWPKAASAYASIGLPVNAVGLDIEDLRWQPSLQDGQPALLVSGVLRNIRTRPVVAPPIAVTMLDRDGRRLSTRSVSVGDPLVRPGQGRGFTISLVNPPSAASDLELTFVMNRRPGTPRAQAPLHPASAPAPAASVPLLRQGPTTLQDLDLPASAAPFPAPPGGASGQTATP